MTEDSFRYEALPMRVRFGAGAVSELRDELDALGFHRSLVLSTQAEAPLAARIAGALGDGAVGVAATAVMHVPQECVEVTLEELPRRSPDSLVPVGGGSAVGLAKAVALETGLPIIAVPTTYAGSEMTPIWGRTSAGVKQTGRDLRVLPRSVIYDPDLTLTLPALVSGVSGINAIAHAVEALYAPDSSPIISSMAVVGTRSLADALPRIVANPLDLEARTRALRGAWLCGACLGNVTMSLHHKLCHALGGALDLPHAEMHAVVLPYVVAFNASAVPDAMLQMADALGEPEPATALWNLGRSVGAPESLGELGVKETDLDHVASLAVASPYANPVPVTERAVRNLLGAALQGAAPTRVP
jgi:maleylacetate reductase